MGYHVESYDAALCAHSKLKRYFCFVPQIYALDRKSICTDVEERLPVLIKMFGMSISMPVRKPICQETVAVMLVHI
jgi:hypothetical protein